MALISCKECGREISDTAAACIGCGAPIGGATAWPSSAGKIEIEATGRRYKNQMLLALAMLFAGCAMVLLVDGTDAAVIGTVVAIGGLLLWLKARFGAWYANG